MKSLVVVSGSILIVCIVCLTFTTYDMRHVTFDKYLADRDYEMMYLDKMLNKTGAK